MPETITKLTLQMVYLATAFVACGCSPVPEKADNVAHADTLAIPASDISPSSRLNAMQCKGEESSIPIYSRFPKFLQVVEPSSAQYYDGRDVNRANRHMPSPNSSSAIDEVLKFEAAAGKYVRASREWNRMGKGEYGARPFQEEMFRVLSGGFAAARAHPHSVQDKVTLRDGSRMSVGKGVPNTISSYPNSSREMHAALISDRVEAEILLLTSAINVAQMRDSNRPIEVALDSILGSGVSRKTLLDRMSEPNSCIGCSTNSWDVNKDLPESLKVSQGARVWALVILSQMSLKVHSVETFKRYANAYRSYARLYYIGDLFPASSDNQEPLKAYQFLASYYPGVNTADLVGGRICSVFVAPLLWDIDLLKQAEKFKVTLTK